MAHVPTYSSAPAWLTILSERHPLHDGCRILFQPTFHPVACLTLERADDLAVVRLRTSPRPAANLYFWSGGRFLRPGPDDVKPLPHARFEAPLPADCDLFPLLPTLDLGGPDTSEFVRDGMPTTTTVWHGARLLADREDNPPQADHLTLCRRALDLAAAHLPDPRAQSCLADIRSYFH
jgi:hypothetical protein